MDTRQSDNQKDGDYFFSRKEIPRREKENTRIFNGRGDGKVIPLKPASQLKPAISIG